MPKTALLLLAALAFATAVGCVGPYRPEIQQGNALAPEAVQKLRAGMTKQQVRYLLGTPLITDPFHQDRWDYVYTVKQGSGKTVRQTLSLQFRDGALAAAEGDLAPAALSPVPRPN